MIEYFKSKSEFTKNIVKTFPSIAFHLCLLAWAMQWIVDNPEIVSGALKINREKV